MIGVLNKIKLKLKSSYLIFKAVRLSLSLLGHYRKRTQLKLDEFWEKRISIVLQSPDNAMIHRVSNAGQIIGDIQVMHNGVKVHVGSYYGSEMVKLLESNRGVHEPQEERAFEEILKYIKPGSAMIELGSFWGFYSITFNKCISNARNYLIEPDHFALLSGKHNFKLNGCEGHFFNYYVGKNTSTKDSTETICVDDFVEKNDIKSVAILHSDIQGFELDMLFGAERTLNSGLVDFIFISTHSNDLHNSCITFLLEQNFDIVCAADLDQTYSQDGLIVAKRKSAEGPKKIDIFLRHD